MPAPTHVKRLAHLCFKTDHLDTMVPFYRDVLGLPVKFTMTNKDGDVFGYYFACGECSFIELFDQRGAVRQWGGEVTTLKTTAAGTLYQHFCLEVNGLEARTRGARGQGDPGHRDFASAWTDRNSAGSRIRTAMTSS